MVGPGKAYVRTEGHSATGRLVAGDQEPPCRPSGLAWFQPLTQSIKKGWNKKKWCFRGMNLEAMNQRHQVEDGGPRDRKVS